MRDESIARNYAEALFEVARRREALDAFEEGLEAVAELLDENREFRLFLETPRVADADRKGVIRSVFGDVLPGPLLNFLLVTIDKRRQRLLPAIFDEFRALLDDHQGRAHVEVTVARELGEEGTEELRRELSRFLDAEAVPHMRVDPRLLGGIVIRTGDTVYDGSLRRRLEGMSRKLKEAEVPETFDAEARDA